MGRSALALAVISLVATAGSATAATPAAAMDVQSGGAGIIDCDPFLGDGVGSGLHRNKDQYGYYVHAGPVFGLKCEAFEGWYTGTPPNVYTGVKGTVSYCAGSCLPPMPWLGVEDGTPRERLGSIEVSGIQMEAGQWAQIFEIARDTVCAVPWQNPTLEAAVILGCIFTSAGGGEYWATVDGRASARKCYSACDAAGMIWWSASYEVLLPKNSKWTFGDKGVEYSTYWQVASENSDCRVIDPVTVGGGIPADRYFCYLTAGVVVEPKPAPPPEDPPEEAQAAVKEAGETAHEAVKCPKQNPDCPRDEVIRTGMLPV